MSVSRREFARWLSLSSTAVLFPSTALAGHDDLERFGLTASPLPQTPAVPGERFWQDVRARFLVPRDVAFFNAANLCPSSLPAIEAHEKHLRSYEAGPSPEARTVLMRGREEARTLLAQALRVTPEEIVLTRNTTESNNVVSSGLDLRAGDEVVVWADNHPSNLNAWQAKAKRFGFTVVSVPVLPAHPGAEGYVDLFTKAFTPRTRLVAITHVSSNSGDLLPAAEICAAARARGILSLVDGAQAFGVLDLDLSADQARLLHRLDAQVAVRTEGERPALRESRRPRSPASFDRRVVWWPGRAVTDVRGQWPTRRRVDRGSR